MLAVSVVVVQEYRVALRIRIPLRSARTVVAPYNGFLEHKGFLCFVRYPGGVIVSALVPPEVDFNEAAPVEGRSQVARALRPSRRHDPRVAAHDVRRNNAVVDLRLLLLGPQHGVEVDVRVALEVVRGVIPRCRPGVGDRAAAYDASLHKAPTVASQSAAFLIPLVDRDVRVPLKSRPTFALVVAAYDVVHAPPLDLDVRVPAEAHLPGRYRVLKDAAARQNLQRVVPPRFHADVHPAGDLIPVRIAPRRLRVDPPARYREPGSAGVLPDQDAPLPKVVFPALGRPVRQLPGLLPQRHPGLACEVRVPPHFHPLRP